MSNVQSSKEFKPMTIEQFKSRLNISLQAIEKGDIISQEDLKKEILKWRNQRNF